MNVSAAIAETEVRIQCGILSSRHDHAKGARPRKRGGDAPGRGRHDVQAGRLAVMCLGDGGNGYLPHCRIAQILKRSGAGRQCFLLLASFFFSVTQSQVAALDLLRARRFLSNPSNLVPASLSARWSSPEKAGPLISHLNPLTLYPFLRVRWSLHVSTRPYSDLSGLGEGGPT